MALRVRPLRLLHSSARSCNLVGPPDPVSNLRPVLYTDLPSSPRPKLRHPYSLTDFAGGKQDDDLQWRLQRLQLDAINHNFWTDSNSRFEAAKQSVLSSLPESSTPLARERALSELYRKWVLQESRRQDIYTTEWRKQNVEAIVFAARMECRNLLARIIRLLTFSKDR
jgi:hypothetical protein